VPDDLMLGLLVLLYPNTTLTLVSLPPPAISSPQIFSTYTHATPLPASTLDQSSHNITPRPRRPRDTAQTNPPASG